MFCGQPCRFNDFWSNFSTSLQFLVLVTPLSSTSLMINSPLQVMRRSVDLHKDFVEVPAPLFGT